MESWKNREMSAPRRGYTSRSSDDFPDGYPSWISRMPRIPPDARKDERDRFMHAAEYPRPHQYEQQNYAQNFRPPEYKRCSKSPYFKDHQPYR